MEKTIKELIIDRINVIKEAEKGFSKSTMRWSQFLIGEQHVSEVDFESIPDSFLVFHFERIVRRYNLQM